MPTDPALDPDVALMLERVRRAARPPFWTMSPNAARDSYRKASRVLDIATRRLARVEDLVLRARDGADLPARLYATSFDRSLPALLYFHGGGFTIGSVDTHDAVCRMLADEAHCVVLSVDYRLAPEHRFPTAVEDACDAFDEMVAKADELGIDLERIAVAGDSAGGTLAAVVAVHARDRDRSLALQLLIYPGTRSTHDTPAHRASGEGTLLDDKTIAWFFDHYAPEVGMREDWRFAPLDGRDRDGRLVDLHGVAAACVVTAGFDPLHDEGMAYADRLAASDVAVQRLDYPGLIHGFLQFAGAVPAARAAHRDLVAALRAAFSIHPTLRSTTS
jgi:acetyl esterase